MQSLRRLRLQAGLTQLHLAAKAGLSLTVVNLAERTGYFSRATAERLAAILKVPVDSLRFTEPKTGRRPGQTFDGRI